MDAEDQIVVEVTLGVTVTELSVLTDAAITHFNQTAGLTAPPEAAETFRQHLRDNPASAVQTLVNPQILIDGIPGVAFEGSTAGARVAEPQEPLPWRRPRSD